MDWDCPKCGTDYDAGHYPDHYSDCRDGDAFEFECECGCTFEVEVTYSVYFRRLKPVTLREPLEPPPTVIRSFKREPPDAA